MNALNIQITEFKFHPMNSYQLRGDSPNLMLAKVSHYNMVVHVFIYTAHTIYANISHHSNLACRAMAS